MLSLIVGSLFWLRELCLQRRSAVIQNGDGAVYGIPMFHNCDVLPHFWVDGPSFKSFLDGKALAAPAVPSPDAEQAHPIRALCIVQPDSPRILMDPDTFYIILYSSSPLAWSKTVYKYREELRNPALYAVL